MTKFSLIPESTYEDRERDDFYLGIQPKSPGPDPWGEEVHVDGFLNSFLW